MRYLVLFFTLQGCVTQTAAASSGLEARSIGEIVGVEATTQSDGVVRVSRMREDVAVTVEGMPLAPQAGLTSWAAFMPTDRGAMVMGDTVVFEDEASAAMDAAFAHGLEVTALHNHFFFDRPPAFFMHVGGHGEALGLAKGIRAMWDAIADVRRNRAQPGMLDDRAVPVGEIDAAALAKVLESEGKHAGPTVKFSWGREARMHGVPFSGSMGLSTWAAFSGSDALAAVDGDFAMTSAEVQPVLRALRKGNIHVVALHNHMIGEAPAYYFVHYWAKGPAIELARSLRGALDAQRNAR
ncbi:MAG: DUF1259 domain-containing protein [Deltaproteobacteria bacterium]